MNFDFTQLSKPKIIEELDFETLFNDRKQSLIELYPIDERDAVRENLSRESEPVVKFLQENSYREILLRNRINKSAEAVLLAFSTGSDLDELAKNYNTYRLVIRPADETKTPPTKAVMESDEAFRERIQLAFDLLSTAGPEAGYKKFARDADGRVGDVSVISPMPCYVTVTILQADSENGAASPELVQIVEKALSPEDVRPIGDRVTVNSAQIVNYSIKAKLFIGKDPEAATLLQQAQRKIAEYANARKRLGRSIHMSAIYAALHVTGVNRVELITPKSDVVLTPAQASYCTNIAIEIGGIE